VLLLANLPLHSHTIAHTHPITHSHTATSNDHDVNHYHAADTGFGGGHEHNYYAQITSPQTAAGASNFYTQRSLSTTSGGGGHSHAFNTGYMSGNNVHGHAITVSGTTVANSGASSAANTGDAGSAAPTAVKIMPPWTGVHFLIKT
jgi:hypothetical protein